jgi:hypothetical protein
MIFVIARFPPRPSGGNCDNLEKIYLTTCFIVKDAHTFIRAHILTGMSLPCDWTLWSSSIFISRFAEIVAPRIGIVFRITFKLKKLFGGILPAPVSFEVIPRLRRERFPLPATITSMHEDLRIGVCRGIFDREEQIVAIDDPACGATFVLHTGPRQEIAGREIFEVGADPYRLHHDRFGALLEGNWTASQQA